VAGIDVVVEVVDDTVVATSGTDVRERSVVIVSRESTRTTATIPAAAVRPAARPSHGPCRRGARSCSVRTGTSSRRGAAATISPRARRIARSRRGSFIAFPGHAGRGWPLARWRSLARSALGRSI
jgi:hypothetical protein